MKNDVNRPPMAVILAAGTGAGLSPLTDTSPTGLLSVGGSGILERMIRNCLSCGISQFVLVLGHRSDQIRQFVDKTFRGVRITYVVNDRYHETDTGYCLMLAASAIGTSDFVKLDVDVVFDVKILRRLVDSNLSNVLCVDRNVAQADAAQTVVADDDMQVLEIGRDVDAERASGATLGIDKISAGTGPLLFAELVRMMESNAHLKDACGVAYAHLLASGAVFHALDITGLNWTKIATADGFAAANTMFGTPIMTVSRGQQRAQDEAAEKAAAAS